jgi:hypothetical protein
MSTAPRRIEPMPPGEEADAISWIALSEAARRAGTSRYGIRKLVSEGHIRVRSFAGRLWYAGEDAAKCRALLRKEREAKVRRVTAPDE